MGLVIEHFIRRHLSSLELLAKYKMIRNLIIIVLVLQFGLAFFALPLDILDAKLLYSPQEAFDYLKGLSPEARRGYMMINAIDIIYIFSYYLLYSLLLYKIYSSIIQSHKKLFVVSMVPLVMACFDLMETSAIFAQQLFLKAGMSFLMKLAALATPMKWLSAIVVFFLIIIGIAINLGKHLKEKNS